MADLKRIGTTKKDGKPGQLRKPDMKWATVRITVKNLPGTDAVRVQYPEQRSEHLQVTVDRQTLFKESLPGCIIQKQCDKKVEWTTDRHQIYVILRKQVDEQWEGKGRWGPGPHSSDSSEEGESSPRALDQGPSTTAQHHADQGSSATVSYPSDQRAITTGQYPSDQGFSATAQ